MLAACVTSARSSARNGCGVPLAELVDATAGIHNFLFAGVERMAIGTNFDLQILADRRARLEFVPASAGDCNFFIVWVNAGFHQDNLEIVLRQNRPRAFIEGACDRHASDLRYQRVQRMTENGPWSL